MFTLWASLPGASLGLPGHDGARPTYSLFSLLAAAAPLILSADLRAPLDNETRATLTNAAVIAVNQASYGECLACRRCSDKCQLFILCLKDPLAAPSLPVSGSTSSPTSVWSKLLAPGGGSTPTAVAVTLLNAAVPTATPISFSFADLGPVGAACAASAAGCVVTDLWAGNASTVTGGSFSAIVEPHAAALLLVEQAAGAASSA